MQGDTAAWQGGVAFGIQSEMNRGLEKARSQRVSGMAQGMETNVRKFTGCRDAASPGGDSRAPGSLAVFCLLTRCGQHGCSVCENPRRISVCVTFQLKVKKQKTTNMVRILVLSDFFHSFWFS